MGITKKVQLEERDKEDEGLETCERCGGKGNLQIDGLCEKCMDELEKEEGK